MKRLIRPILVVTAILLSGSALMAQEEQQVSDSAKEDSAKANESSGGTEIPAATTGVIELQEVKSTNTVDLIVSKSRTFRLKNKIIRISISDPTIAEAIVVNEKDIVLLGKKPGVCSLSIWDDKGGYTRMNMSSGM